MKKSTRYPVAGTREYEAKAKERRAQAGRAERRQDRKTRRDNGQRRTTKGTRKRRRPLISHECIRMNASLRRQNAINGDLQICQSAYKVSPIDCRVLYVYQACSSSPDKWRCEPLYTVYRLI